MADRRRRECFFAHLSERPCDGPPEWAHLIPRQLIKREHPLLAATAEMGYSLRGEARLVLWDQSIIRPACRRHHADFDNARFVLPRADLPQETVDWAERWGLGWWIARTYGDGSPTEGTTSSKSSSSDSSGRS